MAYEHGTLVRRRNTQLTIGNKELTEYHVSGIYLIGDARLDIHHEEDHVRSPDGLERSVHHEELVAVVHLQRQQ